MPRYVVRFGVMRTLGIFNTKQGEQFVRGNKVIARTQRGLEAGEVLCEANESALAQMDNPPNGQILRGMSGDDENELHHMQAQQAREFKTCCEFVEKMNLQMELVDIEHVFGGERIVVYYLAESRVDFRELVRKLASEFQTRIEMRQIGVRDEAKLLADFGDCGKPVCCNTHLVQMPPVSMKMAKLQKATLDPTKISGRCGRLKCCLRYEYDTYRDLKAELPPLGCDIVTREGRARVLNHEILTSQVLIQGEDGRRTLIDAADVLSVVSEPQRKPRKSQKTGSDPSATPQKQPSETPQKAESSEPNAESTAEMKDENPTPQEQPPEQPSGDSPKAD